MGVVALMLPEVQAGRALPGTGWILLGDGLFTALFLIFLLRDVLLRYVYPNVI